MFQCDRPTVELDIVLDDALRRAAEKASQHQVEATVSDKLATSLDLRLKRTQRDMDRELTEKERHIVYIESVLRQRESTIRALEKQTMETKAKLEELEYEMESWRKRCELIEKTRRLGYYFPGWYDKLHYNNSEGIEYDRKKKNWLSRSDDNLQRTPSISSVRSGRTSRASGASSPRKTLKIVRRPLSDVVFKNNQSQNDPVPNGRGTSRSKLAIEYRSSSNVGENYTAAT